jgi:hypothetical protein
MSHIMPTIPVTSEGAYFVIDETGICLRSDQAEPVQSVKALDSNRSEALAMSTLTPSLKDSIAFGIGSVPDVEAVFTMRQEKVFYVWAIVSKSEPGVRKQIYAKEKELIKHFSAFDFDFTIIASKGRPPSSVISDPAAELAYIRQ